MAQVVILGAGLTGLSTAYHLEQKGYFDYVIFEKESIVGGLCRSMFQDGFTFDFTGHLLHAKNPYFRAQLLSLLGEQQLNTIERRSYIYSQQCYTKYPYQINMHGLPASTIATCIEGYVRRKKNNKTRISFADWVLQSFGKGFAEHFFFPYQKKIFSYDLKKITASWTQSFVPDTSLEKIIAGIMQANRQESIGYNAEFFYPKCGGIASLPDALTRMLIGKIFTNFCVEKIDLKEKVLYFTNGHVEPYKALITTIPLDILLHCTQDRSSTDFQKHRTALKCNKVVNFNLGFKKDAEQFNKHWIYFPEPEIPFYRIGFPHNFSSSMTPKGHCSLYGEFSYVNRSSAWITSTVKKARAATLSLFDLSERDIVTELLLLIPHAYVIYDFWREQHLPTLLQSLEREQIYSIGRYGAWKYASMQDALLDGKAIVDRLIFTPAVQAPMFDELLMHETGATNQTVSIE